MYDIKYDIIISPATGSFVPFVRMATLGLDVLRGQEQKPFDGQPFDVWITIDSDIVFTFEQIEKLIKYLSKENIKDIFITLIFISFFAFFIKNFQRIVINKVNNYINYPWPRIYSLDPKKENKIQKFTKIKDNEQFLYFYSGGELCMYGNAPCSNYNVNKLQKKIIHSYSVYYIN